MTTEEKFEAAVNVIRNLPKDVPFKPTTDIMLKFYSYYKQAIEGPCTIPKPNFWDIIGRTKWDAWNKLGSMTREEAMECYVGEMITIVEKMAYSESVFKFMNVLGLGGMVPVDTIRNTVFGTSKKFVVENDKETYCDSEDNDENNEFFEPVCNEYGLKFYDPVQSKNCYQQPENQVVEKYIAAVQNIEVNEQLTIAVKKLQDAVDDVKRRINALEIQINKIPHPKEMKASKLQLTSFNSLSPMAKILIILWPFIVQLSLATVHKRRRFIITNLLILLQYFVGLM